ncbi:MAG: CoA-acylating methylmalonate-semialdehyde dehydrogenase [Ferrimicrobium sp.]
MTIERVSHFIGGKHVTAGERFGEIFNPATGQVIRHVPFADTNLIDEAVEVAAKAQVDWAELSLAKRQRVMFNYREVLLGSEKRIVQAIGEEHGKVAGDAAGEFARGVEVVEFATSAPEVTKGQYSDSVSFGVDAYSIRMPLGVVAGITPFNFPAMVPMWMFPVALAVGNGFILKPSEKDPSASVLLAELFLEAGGPAGLFNVVHGDQAAVAHLLNHPTIKAISFVGSTPVAHSIYERAAAAGKRVQALGGAKNHMVVLPDADPTAVVDAAISAAFGSSGERCMAISVVVLVGDSGVDYLGEIARKMAVVEVGGADETTSEMGPLITEAHRDRVSALVTSAETDGARIVVDGRVHPRTSGPGFFFGPTLIDEVSEEMAAYREEIFGPVLLVMRAGDLGEALAIVNRNPYANGAAIFTSSGGAARTFVRRVDAGMVGVNVPIPVPVAYHSFGGSKSSLFGDMHMHGEEGTRFYTRAKAITARWPGGDVIVPSGLQFVTNQ